MKPINTIESKINDLENENQNSHKNQRRTLRKNCIILFLFLFFKVFFRGGPEIFFLILGAFLSLLALIFFILSVAFAM